MTQTLDKGVLETDKRVEESENSQGLRTDKSEILKKSIRDTAQCRTSSLVDGDPILRELELARKKALDHVDHLVREKLSTVDTLEFREEQLEEIAKERSSQRLAFEEGRTARQSALQDKKKKTKGGTNRTQVEAADEFVPVSWSEYTAQEPLQDPDTRVDQLVDRIVNVLLKGRAKAAALASGIGDASARAAQKIARAADTAASKGRLTCFWEKARGLESKAEDRFALLVDRMDYGLEQVGPYLYGKGRLLLLKWEDFRAFCEARKKGLLAAGGGVLVTAAAVAIFLGSITVYEYSYNGKALGMVKSQSDVLETVDIIGDRLAYAYGAEIEIDKEEDIAFRRVLGFDLKTDTRDDVLSAFTYMRDMNATAYAIEVDGKRMAVLDSRESADELLTAIQGQYTQESDAVKYKTIGFAEQVRVKELQTKLGNIQSEEEALEFMLTGAVEKKIHTVAQGDTFYDIAKKYGIRQSELENSNPEITPEKLQIGDQIVLNQICPVVTVETTEVAEFQEPIPFEIAYEDTGALYKGEQTVKAQGTNGQKRVVAEIVRENGMEIGRTVLETEVVAQPVSQVVLRGTKDKPALVGSGTYVYPTRGRISSRFGSRWGRTHYGLDIAAPSGTRIVASDGGTVTSAGWERSYGYVVRINHGGGIQTTYAHCSKLAVKKGDKVYQGQYIANVGSTGNSTGPHVHFEVRVDGVAKNPLNYLN